MKISYIPTKTEEKYGKLYIVTRKYITSGAANIYNLVSGDLTGEQEIKFWGEAPTKEQIKKIAKQELKDIKEKQDACLESIKRAKNPPSFFGKKPLTEEREQKALANLESVVTELRRYYS